MLMTSRDLKERAPSQIISSMKQETLSRLKRVQGVITELGNQMYMLCFKTFVSMLIHYIKSLSSLEGCLIEHMPVANFNHRWARCAEKRDRFVAAHTIAKRKRKSKKKP